MHFTFYLGDSGRIGLNLQFNSDVKSGLSIVLKCVCKETYRHVEKAAPRKLPIKIHSVLRQANTG